MPCQKWPPTRVVGILLTLALAVVLAAQTDAPSSTPGLEVQHLKTSTTGEVVFDLRNTSQQPAVAWLWEFTGTLLDGTKTGGGGGVDAYRLLDQPHGSGEGPILPGKSREEHAQIDPTARDIAVTITAVVYADGSATGRSSAIDEIEQKRSEEIEALRVLLGFAENLKRSQDVKADIGRILADLNTAEQAWSSDQRHRMHKGHTTNILVQTVLRQQLRFLEQATSGGPTEQATMEQLEKSCKLELERSIRNAPKLRRQP